MAALQGVAETYAGKNLSLVQKATSIADLMKSGVMDKDFTVNDSKAVLKDALGRLGIDTSKINIAIARPGDRNYDKVKSSATASLRHVGRRDGIGGAGHWEQGDKNGAFFWDPISGKDDGGRENYPKETRYIIISRRKVLE